MGTLILYAISQYALYRLEYFVANIDRESHKVSPAYTESRFAIGALLAVAIYATADTFDGYNMPVFVAAISPYVWNIFRCLVLIATMPMQHKLLMSGKSTKTLDFFIR